MQKLLLTFSFLLGCLIFSCTEPKPENEPSLTEQNKNTIDGADSLHTAVVEKEQQQSLLKPVASDHIANLAQLQRRLSKKASSFVINCQKDTVIRCKEGTLLTIPANAFLNALTQQPIQGKVKIKVKEFYKLSDMLIAGLSTTSNKRLLETGGMVNIRVIHKDTKDSCILKPGKNINIAMPNANAEAAERMRLFNGVHDSSGFNWITADGSAGLAQAWRRGGRFNRPSASFTLDPGLVFPDGVYKIKPDVISAQAENLVAEIKVPIRDLMRESGLVTKKASAYIDTVGNLQCYKIRNTNQEVTFHSVYSPSVYRQVKINLAVEVMISYRAKINHEYYLKLFKMGEGNPDSLIAISATLNPTIKFAPYHSLATVFKNALTAQEFLDKKEQRDRLKARYEESIKKFDQETKVKLIKFEKEGISDLESAQDYLILNTSKLGWINCDRFYKAPETIEYFVHLEDKASLLMVFNNIKSIVSSDAQGKFARVPLNEPITLIGIKTENGKLLMAQQETTVTKQGCDKLLFKPVTVQEYKSRLERLNKL